MRRIYRSDDSLFSSRMRLEAYRLDEGKQHMSRILRGHFSLSSRE
jgi:hypothetical protein